MSGALEQVMRDVTLAVTRSLGTDVIIIRRTTDYDPITRERDTIAHNHPAKSSPPYRYNIREIDGITILKDDVRFLVAAKGLKIEIDPDTDFLSFRGTEYRIVDCSPLSAGEQPAAYELQCRK